MNKFFNLENYNRKFVVCGTMFVSRDGVFFRHYLLEAYNRVIWSRFTKLRHRTRVWFDCANARVHANRVPWQLVSREELNLRRVVVAVIDISELALFVFFFKYYFSKIVLM